MSSLQSAIQLRNIIIGVLLVVLLLTCSKVSTSNGGANVAHATDGVVSHCASINTWLPSRRDKYSLNALEKEKTAKTYERVWGEGGGGDGDSVARVYDKDMCWACRYVSTVVARVPFETVLDAGAGSGLTVQRFRDFGKCAAGIELSAAAIENGAPHLLQKGLLEVGTLMDLPYADNQFDLVFSGDVLEHIQCDQAEQIASELVRVAKRWLVLTISKKPSRVEGLHTCLRARSWWERIFEAAGTRVHRELRWALQDKEPRYRLREKFDDTLVSAAPERKRCSMQGDDTQGGRYEVCELDVPWLFGAPERQVIRVERAITTDNDEVEPWFYAFEVL